MHAAGFGFVDSRQGRRRRAGRVRVGHQHQGSDARRSRARAHRAQDGGEPSRRAHHPHSRARQLDDRRPLRRRRLGSRLRAAVRSPRGDRRACADGPVGSGRAGRDGRRGNHHVADGVARAGWQGHRGARRHQRAGGRHRDHHPQVRHPRRARRGGDRGSARVRTGQRDRTSRGAPISGRRSRSPSTASTRATSTTRSASRSCRTGITGSACTSPTWRTT